MYIPTAREQKRLGTIGVKRDGYDVAYKVGLGLHQLH